MPTTRRDASPKAHTRSCGQLSLQHVTKRYGQQCVVDDVSLDVTAGEFVTILGPSGSGKTTSLGIIAGFTQPDNGAVYLDEVNATSVPPHRRDIGVVFQNYALFPHMTAAANVAFPLAMRKRPKEEIRARVADALDRVHLTGYEERYPRQLSGGQQQRVALARAFVFGPRLLLMDEPLGALDKKLREELELQMVELCRALAMTAVYVTHDQEEALVMSDRIVILNNGRIEQEGAANVLYERPQSRFVAEFLGESNILEGVVEPSGGGHVLNVGSERIPVMARDADARTSAALVIRPEHVHVLAAGDRNANETSRTRLRGVLREAIYLGSDLKLLVDLDLGVTVRARVRPGATMLPSPGEAVAVSWEPARAVLVPATSEAPPTGEHDAERDETVAAAGAQR